jgi:hypothetical protein
VVALQVRIAEQDARIVELERQLAASSRNQRRPLEALSQTTVCVRPGGGPV